MVSVSRRAATFVTVLVLASAFCFEQARLIRDLLARYTNEDHAILWLAASDWARLRPHEPTFYGQTYGVNLEAIPIALFHGLGMSYGWAFPVAMVALAACAWAVLGWAAWQRSAPIMTVAAAAAPILLNLQHWIIVGVIGTGVGRLLAAVGAALALRDKASPRHAFAVVSTTTVALVLDTASATLALPALVWALSGLPRHRSAWKLWLWAAAGVLPAIAWIAFNAWFNRMYPDHALHPAPTFDPTLSVLKDNLLNPDRLFGQQALQLLPSGKLVLGLFVLFWLIALVMQAYRELAAVSFSLALTLGLASLPKTFDSMNSIWFPAARMSLTTPMALWFAAMMAYLALRGRIAWRDIRVESAFVVLAVLLSAWTLSVRAAHWQPRLARIEDAGIKEGRLPLRRVEQIERLCNDVAESAALAHTRIVIFPGDRTAAYGCAALHRHLLTAFPGYERRYWVLRHLGEQPANRMLVWEMNADTCKRKRVRKGFEHCESVAYGQGIRLDYRAKPPLEALRALDIKPRPFGADCNPGQRETCKWWASRYQ